MNGSGGLENQRFVLQRGQHDINRQISILRKDRGRCRRCMGVVYTVLNNSLVDGKQPCGDSFVMFTIVWQSWAASVRRRTVEDY
jgi:hypothetical protein